VRVFVGYDFLYWSDVARPGDQADPRIDPARVPALGGPGRTAGTTHTPSAIQESDFWAQGLHVGAEFRY
jgi:hypothetical protein